MVSTMTIHTDVVDGDFKEVARNHIRHFLKGLNGKRVTVAIRPFVKTRSSNQSRFLHGVFLKAMQGMFHDAGSELSAEQVKELFKEKFGVRESITMPDGSAHDVLKSTAKYSTVEIEESMERARSWAANYGVMLPFPNEDRYGGL